MKHSAPPRTAAAVPSPEELLDIMADQSRPLRLDAFLRVLGLVRRRRRELEQTLNALAAEGRVLRLRGGLWVRPEHLKHIAGRFTALRDGGGFVTPVR
ncbi:MAG: ribonuclease R, partial [Desulfovibrio sp.]|nr:ribonuclease R [Desulfovibrio sp.]